MVVYSPILSGRVELKVVSSDDTVAKTKTTSLFTDKLEGHVVRLSCDQTTGTEVVCWIQTSENYLYLTTFTATVAADGNLSITGKKKNRYTVGENEFIKGCSVSSQFVICNSEDLTQSDPKKKSSLLLFRFYPDSEDQTYYSFAVIKGDAISEIPPDVSAISFKNLPSSRRRMLTESN